MPILFSSREVPEVLFYLSISELGHGLFIGDLSKDVGITTENSGRGGVELA